MSLLSAIASKKDKLRPTRTVVTTVDGRKFVQTENDCTEIAGSYGFVVDTKPDNTPAKVLDFLYVGSQDCCQLDVLVEHRIRYVLSVGVDAPVKHPEQVLKYKWVMCLDLPETDIRSVLGVCNDFIREGIERRLNVLVHCNAGVSRSTSVVIGYLMLMHNYSYIEAYNAVKVVRTCVKPNIGFELQLKELSKF